VNLGIRLYRSSYLTSVTVTESPQLPQKILRDVMWVTLYTKIDAQCDKLTKTLATVDVPSDVVKFFLARSLKQSSLECGPMPNVMAALANVGGVLCSTPRTLADAHYSSAVQ